MEFEVRDLAGGTNQLLPGPDSATSSSTELEKKFAPYVRRDAYGAMGRGELPAMEKVLLGLAILTLVPIRLVVGLSLLLLYYVICRICTMLSGPFREEEQEDYAHMRGWRREVVVRCGKFLSRAMLFTLGFYWINEAHRTSSSEE